MYRLTNESLAFCASVLGVLLYASANAQVAITPPAGAPAYLAKSWQASLMSPLPARLTPAGVGAQVGQNELDLNIAGILGTYQPGGATVTAGNAFFQSLGTNGRSCSTCHEPSSAMSINLSTIVARYALTAGTDPLFAPVDGANCPNQVPAADTKPAYWGGLLGKGGDMLKAHSLILTRGVIRIFLPVPPMAEYSLSVVSDPTTCNLDKNYAQMVDSKTKAVSQIVSVYRRPRMSSNLKFMTNTLSNTGILPPFDLISNAFFPVDPFTHILESGNIMWDGREPTLQSQAIDATLGHAQAAATPSDAQVAQMVAFETGVFSAQSSSILAGSLTALGAMGGPVNLQPILPGQAAALAPVAHVSPFDAWSTVTGSSLQNLQRESIYRGQQIFNTRPFTINNVAGLNNIPNIFTNPTVGTCALCHNQIGSGNDAAPAAQHDIGVGGTAQTIGGPAPAKDLPIFKLTCNTTTAGVYAKGASVLTNDPGMALITGKCADIGRTTVPQLRGLAARAPYFHDGSAANLLAVVNFYNTRFAIGLSTQDKTDLANFLSAL
jgi:cytochrome c peroxidase